jgi:hypothetical protein
VGGAIAVLRWSFAQPPANRVRPLPGPKTKAAKRGTRRVNSNALIPERAKYSR